MSLLCPDCEADVEVMPGPRFMCSTCGEVRGAKSHKTATLDYRGEPIEVDLGMVELVTALWRHGIATTNCCQGDEGDEAYIAIDARDFGRFLDLIEPVVEVLQEARRRRLNIHCNIGGPGVRSWSKAYPERFDSGLFHAGDGWVVDCCMRFPHETIPTITECLQ